MVRVSLIAPASPNRRGDARHIELSDSEGTGQLGRMRILEDPGFFSAGDIAMLERESLVETVTDILGPDVDCVLSQHIFEHPEALGQPWHQDES